MAKGASMVGGAFLVVELLITFAVFFGTIAFIVLLVTAALWIIEPESLPWTRQHHAQVLQKRQEHIAELEAENNALRWAQDCANGTPRLPREYGRSEHVGLVDGWGRPVDVVTRVDGMITRR